jgi:formylglycine-generating enzyme required for sulfatase activity
MIGLPPGQIAPGSVFRDCAFCPDLVTVPTGEFTMGSEGFESERPVHLVRIARPFAIGRTEVTFAQWEACAEDGGCPYRPDGEAQNRAALPVSGVSWTDAKAYVDWLTRKLGHRYRLPSEAEWEYVARAGTATPFWWGTEAQAGFANCRGCGGSGGQRVLPVASYPANVFGLHDTAGNIAEWVEDCWTPSYDLAEASAAAGSGACKRRVLRGGSFDAGQRFARSASRFLYDAELRYYTNGFRVLREMP